jgi:hypothetical protein
VSVCPPYWMDGFGGSSSGFGILGLLHKWGCQNIDLIDFFFFFYFLSVHKFQMLMINAVANFLGIMLNIKSLLSFGFLSKHELHWSPSSVVSWGSFNICALDYCVSHKGM